MQECLKAHVGGVVLRDLIYSKLKHTANFDYIHSQLIEGKPDANGETILVGRIVLV